VENQWDLLAPLGIEPPERAVNPIEIAVDPAAAESVAARLGAAGVAPDDEVIVMHVSAGNPFRRWPLDSFVAAGVAIVTPGRRRRLVVTSGPSDVEAAGRVLAGVRARLGPDEASRAVGCGEFSLAELRALADRAALYIGGDSGPMHIASASHVPIVALYGPTLPARSAPWREAAWAHEAVEVSNLPCRPCDQRSCMPGDYRCLTWISPDDVVSAARRVLDRSGAKM
jgi:ADP-heptose:LPS heptosyltransferase